HLAGIIVNQVHGGGAGPSGSAPPPRPAARDGAELLAWLRDRDARGFTALRNLVTDGTPVAALPLLAEPPDGLAALEALGREARARLDAVAAVRYDAPAVRRGRRRSRPAPGGGAAWSG
ncbi:MAG TPA: hypothetical protein VFH97_02275, partial [Gemmatimonadales bacterium]|nr:hypothetical protein [Gemmatimonadales bacterium]